MRTGKVRRQPLTNISVRYAVSAFNMSYDSIVDDEPYLCAKAGEARERRAAILTSSLVAEDVDFRTALSSALAEANVPTLQMLCVQLTGDERWLEPPFTPTRSRGVDDNDSGGLAPAVQDEIRTGAYEAILAWRAGRPVAIPRPTAAQLIEMMSVSTGEPIPDAYGPMMADRFDAFTGFASTPVKHPVPQGFSVLIVGAGMSGIAAAVKLREAGVPFIIVEKGDDVGGVWRQNRYPACGVDTPSHLYSYTFAQGDWEHYFGKKPEIDGYFRDVAVNFGIFDDIQFNTEVVAARYDETGTAVGHRSAARRRND